MKLARPKWTHGPNLQVGPIWKTHTPIGKHPITHACLYKSCHHHTRGLSRKVSLDHLDWALPCLPHSFAAHSFLSLIRFPRFLITESGVELFIDVPRTAIIRYTCTTYTHTHIRSRDCLQKSIDQDLVFCLRQVCSK